MKTKYRFSHRAGGRYYWYAIPSGDSRWISFSCTVDWFWGRS